MRCRSCECILDGSPYCFSSKENSLKCEMCVENEMDKNSDKYIEELRYTGETLDEARARVEKVRQEKLAKKEKNG